MPTIPGYDGRQVNIGQIGSPSFSMNAPDASGLTRGLAQVDNAIEDHILKEREKADTAATMDVDRQLNDWRNNAMFNPNNGIYGRKGSNALDVTNQTLPEYDKFAKELIEKAPNERVKARAQQIYDSQRNSFSNELNRYEYGQRQEYYTQTANANLKSSAEGAVLYYNDPDKVNGYLNKGLAVIESEGMRQGLPAEAVAQNRLAFTSGVQLQTIDRLMLEDPTQALTRYAQNKDAMTAEDQARVEKVLVPQMQAQQGAAIADQLLRGGSLDYKAYMPALFNQESGSRQLNADGTPVTSPKGATGKGQIMPTTGPEAAKLAGVPWDEEKFKYDEAYNACLSDAYCREQFRKFQDPVLGLAAYNAGPGRVQQTIDKVGDPRTGEVTHEQFLAALPKETQGYVSNIMKKTPQPKAGAADVYAGALSAIQSMPPGKARDAAEARIKDFKTAADAEDKALYEQAAEQVKTGGFNSLTPEMQRSLSADNVGKLLTLDKKLREGIPMETTPGKLDEFLTIPAEKLASLSLERDIRPYLSDRDYTTVQSAWQAARKGDGSVQGIAKAEEANLKFVMNKAEILTGTSEKALKEENLKKQEKFRAAYLARRDSFVAINKREPTLEESQGLAEMLLLDVKLKGGGTLWGDSGIKLWEAQPEDTVYLSGDMSIDAVPAMERMTIVKELRAQGVPASEETIVAAYQNKLRANQLEIK